MQGTLTRYIALNLFVLVQTENSKARIEHISLRPTAETMPLLMTQSCATSGHLPNNYTQH